MECCLVIYNMKHEFLLIIVYRDNPTPTTAEESPTPDFPQGKEKHLFKTFLGPVSIALYQFKLFAYKSYIQKKIALNNPTRLICYQIKELTKQPNYLFINHIYKKNSIKLPTKVDMPLNEIIKPKNMYIKFGSFTSNHLASCWG